MRRRKYTIRVDSSHPKNFDPNLEWIVDEISRSFIKHDSDCKPSFVIEVNVDNYKYPREIGETLTCLIDDYLNEIWTFADCGFYYEYYLHKKLETINVVKCFVYSLFEYSVPMNPNVIKVNIWADIDEDHKIVVPFYLAPDDVDDPIFFDRLKQRIVSDVECTRIKPDTLLRLWPMIYYRYALMDKLDDRLEKSIGQFKIGS